MFFKAYQWIYLIPFSLSFFLEYSVLFFHSLNLKTLLKDFLGFKLFSLIQITATVPLSHFSILNVLILIYFVFTAFKNVCFSLSNSAFSSHSNHFSKISLYSNISAASAPVKKFQKVNLF